MQSELYAFKVPGSQADHSEAVGHRVAPWGGSEALADFKRLLQTEAPLASPRGAHCHLLSISFLWAFYPLLFSNSHHSCPRELFLSISYQWLSLYFQAYVLLASKLQKEENTSFPEAPVKVSGLTLIGSILSLVNP